MARDGQRRALQDNGDVLEVALTRATQRAATLAQAIAAVLAHDADYQALVGQYRQAGGSERTIRVSAEAGGLGCHITIRVALDGPAPAAGGAP